MAECCYRRYKSICGYLFCRVFFSPPSICKAAHFKTSGSRIKIKRLPSHCKKLVVLTGWHLLSEKHHQHAIFDHLAVRYRWPHPTRYAHKPSEEVGQWLTEKRKEKSKTLAHLCPAHPLKLQLKSKESTLIIYNRKYLPQASWFCLAHSWILFFKLLTPCLNHRW